MFLAGASVMVPGTVLVLLLSPGVAHTIVDWLRSIFMNISDWLDAQHKAAATSSGGFNFNFGCSIRPELVVPTTPGSPFIPPLPSEGAAGMSPVVIWIIVFAIFLALVALVVFALRRRKARRKTRLVEPVQFQVRMVSFGMLRSLLFLLPQLLKKLWLWLALLFQKLKKRSKTSEEPLVSIRALYRNLLSWAAKQGLARIPSQTPIEHLGLLEQRFPQHQEDLKRVTEAYLLARYSQKMASKEEFDSAKEAWQRVMFNDTTSQVRI
jgi:hypothetical protein